MLTLPTDASLKGVGAILLQDGHSIYFSSKSYQLHQNAYDVIELGSLAVVWTMRKFHISCLAKGVQHETDQCH